VLQCVAVCCSVLQCVAVCCSVLQCVAVCCSVLQCAAVCCSGLQWVAVRCSVFQWVTVCCCSVLLCAAGCCSVLRCAAVCCSVLQCIVIPSVTWDTTHSYVWHDSFVSYLMSYWLMSTECTSNMAEICDMGHDSFICVSILSDVEHTATHCNTLQHTATHCNTRLIHMCVYIGWWCISLMSTDVTDLSHITCILMHHETI